MRGIIPAITTFLFFLLSISILRSQPLSLSFHSLTDENLLPALSNEFIFHDSFGYVWISSTDGLVRFDGKNIKTYRDIPNHPNSLNGNYLNGFFFEDKKHNIWFSTFKAIHCYDRSSDDFKTWQLENKDGKKIASGYFTFHLDGDDQLWVRTGDDIGHLLFKFDTQSKTSTLMAKIQGNRQVPILDSGGKVTGVISSMKSNQAGIEVTRFMPFQQNVFFDKNDPSGLPTLECFNVFPDGDHWWITTEKGLVHFNPKDKSYQLYEETPSGKPIGTTWGIEPLYDSLLIVTGVKTGVFIFDKKNKIFTQQILPTKNKSAKEGATYREIYLDPDENLWVSVWGKGVEFANLKKNKFDKIEDLNGFSVLDIFEDHKKNIWVSTAGNGVFVFNHEKERIFEGLKIEGQNALNGKFSFFFEDEQSNLWAVDKTTFYQWIPTQKTFKKVGSVEKILQDVRLLENGSLVALALRGGIFELDLNEQQVALKPFRLVRFEEEVIIHEFFKDTRGRWFFEMIGEQFFIFQEQQDSFQLLKKVDAGGFLNDYFDHPDSLYLYVASSEGILKIDKDSLKSDLLNQEDGLPAQWYNFVLIDSKGVFWMTGKNGLYSYNPQTKMRHQYTEADGLLSKQFNLKARLQRENGEIWVGGKNGLNIFHPENIKEIGVKAVVQFTSFEVEGKPFELDAPIGMTDSIELKYAQNNFSARFIGIEYSDPEKVQLRHKLSGIHEDWVNDGNPKFTNLWYGTYTLEAQASNSDGVWSDSKKLTIKILPPFWVSWWFILASAATFFGIIFWIYRIRVRQKLAKAEKAFLLQQDKFRTEFYTNFTHEFKTPLTVILGNAEHIEGNPREKKKIFRAVDELIFKVNQVLNISKVRTNQLELNYIQGNVIKLINYVGESFQTLGEVNEIDFSMKFEKEELWMDYDEEQLQTILNNLLSNAMKFTGTGGKVELRAEEIQENGQARLQIEVEDTGAGIPASDLEKIFERFGQVEKDKKDLNEKGTGIGLAFSKQLVELMEGQILVESERGKGSIFKVILPIKNNAPLVQEMESDEEVPVLENYEVLENEGLGIVREEDAPHLLIIEDNPAVVEHIIRCVQDDYIFSVARNGEQGIQKALEIIPDIIISDVMMPKKNGYQVVAFLKNDPKTSHIPIMLLTAKTSMQSELEGLKSGANHYMTKPFRKDVLLLYLKNMLAFQVQLQSRYQSLIPPDPPADEFIKKEDEFVQKLREHVEQNIEEIAPPDLPKVVYLSASQLNRKLKALTGKTPSQFINIIKMNKGKEMLQDLSIPIKEIALDLGYTTDYFARVFKNEFKVNPTEYRNQLKKS